MKKDNNKTINSKNDDKIKNTFNEKQKEYFKIQIDSKRIL